MSDPKELFPFPVVEPLDQPDQAAGAKNTSRSFELPTFPTPAETGQHLQSKQLAGESLTDEEIREIRIILEEYRSKSLKIASPLPISGHKLPVAPQKSPEPYLEKGLDLKEAILETLSGLSVGGSTEEEARSELKEILKDLNDPRLAITVWTAVAGLFPLRECLRHGTPDQRIFALISLGDRFCETLAGLRWAGRQPLIKLIGRYLSEVSDNCSFFCMEQEPFQPSFHERVPGASSGSSQVREMRGFLVVRRQNNQVVRLGRVWT